MAKQEMQCVRASKCKPGNWHAGSAVSVMKKKVEEDLNRSHWYMLRMLNKDETKHTCTRK